MAAIVPPTAIVAAAALIGSFLLVPRHEFRRLAPFGLLAGLVPGTLILALGGPILKFWSFHDRLQIAGIPVLLAGAWYPGEIVFAHAFGTIARRPQRLALIAAAALAAAIVYHYLVRAGVWRNLRPFDGTRIFILSAFVQALLAVYLHRKSPPRNGVSAIPPLY